MDDQLKCCPECGSQDFKQRRVALIEYTVHVYMGGGEVDAGEETVDGGDRDGPLVCECGEEYESYDELSTPEEYSASEEDESTPCV